MATLNVIGQADSLTAASTPRHQGDLFRARDTAMSTATTLITSLLRCVLWLIRHGIYVTGFRGWQSQGIDRVAVTVAASPYLYRLFGDECTWITRRQDGVLTVFTWRAERFGVRIEWEEVQCGCF